MKEIKFNETKSLAGYKNLSEDKSNTHTIEIGYGCPKIKSHLKAGNLIIHNTRHFNWFERKMWKLLLGFDIENIKEN
jgi:hypothetical protein